VNFAELYFDGVQGIRNRTEFTPMNDDVRRDVSSSKASTHGPLHERPRDPKKLRAFLDYRVDLAAASRINGWPNSKSSASKSPA